MFANRLGDIRDRIIECHKGGQDYKKNSKEMNLALRTIGNIIRKYKKYAVLTTNLPSNWIPRKINQRTSRWISRNVQINPFIKRSEIKTDIEGAGINLSKYTISSISYRLSFKITKKNAFTKNQSCQRPIKVCRNLWKERSAVLRGKGEVLFFPSYLFYRFHSVFLLILSVLSHCLNGSRDISLNMNADLLAKR